MTGEKKHDIVKQWKSACVILKIGTNKLDTYQYQGHTLQNNCEPNVNIMQYFVKEKNDLELSSLSFKNLIP